MNEGELLTALREKLKNIEAAGETLTLQQPFLTRKNSIFQDLRSQSQTLMISTRNNRIVNPTVCIFKIFVKYFF